MNTYGLAGQIFSVSGKKAIVTGGTRGLGKEMVVCLLENGCDVFVVSRKANDNEDLKDFANQTGKKIYLHSCDITNPEEVVKMVSAAKEAMGRIDILINAAGINILKPFTEMDDEFFCFRHAIQCKRSIHGYP